ncbi:hypothetical protein PR048_019202 [Dryococelus australis]|uniref:Uncharacterized protein n=1 Tax=Dryococelus australis TaxID=614101 RepID=A0ABQ9H2V3_9NEOP|nr:hypothetical protein PR048_019202 [Dryococelus australis]
MPPVRLDDCRCVYGMDIRFIRNVKQSVTENALLILDEHSNYTQSLDSIDLARKKWDVFTDADFAAASVTDRQFQESGAKAQEQPIEPSSVSLNVMMPEQMESNDDELQSKVYDPLEINNDVLGSPATHYISTEEIDPLPSCSFSPEQKKRRRREVSGTVLTSTLHKGSLSKSPRFSSKTSASTKRETFIY